MMKPEPHQQPAESGQTPSPSQPTPPAPPDTDVLHEIAKRVFAPANEQIRVGFGAGTHPGKVRARNEDHYLLVRRRRSREVLHSNLPDSFPTGSNEDAYVLCVADGIGGGVFGDFASRFALEAGWELGGDEINWQFRATAKEIEDVLYKIQLYPLLIHKLLMAETKRRPELTGMGTTLTAAYTFGSDAFITHVGDSRALLVREGQLHQLTTDQTLAEYYSRQQNFETSPEMKKRLSHVLISCLGAVDDQVEVETHHVRLRDGDTLLLCSDGLTDMVDDETIASTVTSIADPQVACDQLIELALEGGGRDNITVVLGKYRIEDDESTVDLEY